MEKNKIFIDFQAWSISDVEKSFACKEIIFCHVSILVVSLLWGCVRLLSHSSREKKVSPLKLHCSIQRSAAITTPLQLSPHLLAVILYISFPFHCGFNPTICRTLPSIKKGVWMCATWHPCPSISSVYKCSYLRFTSKICSSIKPLTGRKLNALWIY